MEGGVTGLPIVFRLEWLISFLLQFVLGRLCHALVTVFLSYFQDFESLCLFDGWGQLALPQFTTFWCPASFSNQCEIV